MQGVDERKKACTPPSTSVWNKTQEVLLKGAAVSRRTTCLSVLFKRKFITASVRKKVSVVSEKQWRRRKEERTKNPKLIEIKMSKLRNRTPLFGFDGNLGIPIIPSSSSSAASRASKGSTYQVSHRQKETHKAGMATLIRAPWSIGFYIRPNYA